MIILPHSTTAAEFGVKRLPRYVPAAFANLVRDRFSRIYFARAKVLGVPLRRSLKTKSVEVARMRLKALLDAERARILSLRAGAGSVATFKALALRWEAGVESSDLKPRAKEYRISTLQLLFRTWPGLDMLPPAKVTEAATKEWAEGFKKLSSVRGKPYSPSRWNGCVETFRAICRLGVEDGLMAGNPGMRLERAKIVPREKVLPPVKSFRALLAELDRLPSRSRAALSVRFLAYTGARVSAAAKVLPRHVSLERNEISIPAVKHQERPLVIPMLPALRKVVKELLDTHPGGDLALLPIYSPRKALAHACRDLGLPPMTPHDLRHLFTTHLLESGLSVADIARLRGDRDGGAMLLKTYGHLRSEHLARVVKSIKF